MSIFTHGSFTGQPGDDRSVVFALSSLSEALSHHDPSEAFNTALDFVETLIDVDSSCLILKALGEERVAVAAHHNLQVSAYQDSPCIGEGIARSVMSEVQPLCIEELKTDPRDGLGSLSSAGYASVLCAPIMTGELGLGALMALSGNQRSFSISDMEILMEIAKAISEYLLAEGKGWQILPMERETATISRAEKNVLKDIQEYAAAASSANDFEELIRLTSDKIIYLLGANAFSVLLLDSHRRTLNVRYSQGLSDEMCRSIEHLVFSGLADLSVDNVRERIEKDIVTLPEFLSCGYISLCIPLKTGRRLNGLIIAFRFASGGVFNERDTALAEILATHLSEAVTRIRLQQESAKKTLQLSTLMEVGKAITAMLDLGVVSEQIAVQARNITHSLCAILYYYDPVNDRVRYAAQSGCDFDNRDNAMNLSRNLAISAARYNRIIYAEELKSLQDRKLAESLDADRWCAIPFKHRGHRIAVVVIVPRNDYVIDPDTEELLLHFGELSAVALQNARIYTREHLMAKVMQESIFASNSPVNFKGLEIAHRLIPEHEVGGDYYDFIEVDENLLGVVMADVAGSSVRAATYIAIGKNALRAYAREYRCPAEVLTCLNKLICHESAADIFISLVYALIDTSKKQITYSIAGHEPPLLIKPGGSKAYRLTGKGILLGVHYDASFESKTKTFNNGDILSLYTDGLTEARIDGRRFGLHRLRESIGRMTSRPVQEIVDTVITERLRFSQNKAVDDMALVLVKMTED